MALVIFSARLNHAPAQFEPSWTIGEVNYQDPLNYVAVRWCGTFVSGNPNTNIVIRAPPEKIQQFQQYGAVSKLNIYATNNPTNYVYNLVPDIFVASDSGGGFIIARIGAGIDRGAESNCRIMFDIDFNEAPQLPPPPAAKCGDGVCHASETTSSCSADCRQICPQVVTRACNPATKEIREFPTSCIPDGWTTNAEMCPPVNLKPSAIGYYVMIALVVIGGIIFIRRRGR